KEEKKKITGRSLCYHIGQDLHVIAAQVFRVWHFFLSVETPCGVTYVVFVRIEVKTKVELKQFKSYYYFFYFFLVGGDIRWEHSFAERWGACILREQLTIRDRTRVVSTSLSEHERISRIIRQQKSLEQLPPPPVQDCRYMINSKHQAVIFEQSYNIDNSSSASNLSNVVNPIGSQSLPQSNQPSDFYVLVPTAQDDHRNRKKRVMVDPNEQTTSQEFHFF
ncbi:hypothetical protein RFI_37426, partial [Reticulomyxa filosa]